MRFASQTLRAGLMLTLALAGLGLAGCQSGKEPVAKREFKKPAGLRVANWTSEPIELKVSGQQVIAEVKPGAVATYTLFGIKNQKIEAISGGKPVFQHELTPETWRGYTVVATAKQAFLVEKEIRDADDNTVVVTFVNSTGGDATFKYGNGQTVTVKAYSGTEPIEVDAGGFAVQATSSEGKANLDQPVDPSHGYTLFFFKDKLQLVDNKPNRKPLRNGNFAAG